MIDSIIHRFTGMSSVVFSPLYHYLYFDVTPYVVRHIMIYRYPANPLYRYQHIPVYSYFDVTSYAVSHIMIYRYLTIPIYCRLLSSGTCSG